MITPLSMFLENGGKIQQIPTRKVRKSEKTFPNRVGSIWSAGRKNVTLQNEGYSSKRHK